MRQCGDALSLKELLVQRPPGRLWHARSRANTCGADDAEAPVLVGAFSQGLGELGWIIGRNARIDYRWYQSNAEAARAYAAELLALTPDIILTTATPGTMAVKQLTRTVPIVFVNVGDPVGAGIVDSLARPGGNITGFMAFDYSFGGKLLDLLKEIAPHLTRVAVFRDDTNPGGIGTFAAVQAMATSGGLQVMPVGVRSSDEIASAVEAFAHSPNGGAVVTSTALYTVHRDLILKLIARYKLPAIYNDRISIANGGVMSYGPIALTCTGARPAMSIASLKARSLPTFRFRRPRSMSWSSILKPPRRSAFQRHNHCCLAPTR